MEQPYTGRAILADNITSFKIMIPARKNWFAIIFLGAWMCGWFVGEIFAIGALLGLMKGNPVGFFMLFWLIGWTAGGFFAFKTFWWNLNGKEIITIGQGQLVLDREGSLLYKQKVYDLNEVKDMRVRDDNNDAGFFGRRNDFGAFNIGGTFRFDYGLKTIKFGAGVDEAEAKYILQKLSDKHFIKD